MQGEFQFISHDPNFNEQLYHEKPILSTRLHPRTNSRKKGGEKRRNTHCVNLINNQNPFSQFEIYLHTILFFSILWRCHTGIHLQGDLATFGYRQAIKLIKILLFPSYLPK